MATQPTNTVALRYVPEVTPGTSPTSGWKEIRYTGESLAPTQDTTESAEIVASRESQGAVRTGVGGAGGFNVEMHYGTFDDFLAAAFFGAWTGPHVLKVGSVAASSMSIEKKFGALTTPQYQLFAQAYADSFSIDIAVKQIMTGGFTFLSKQPVMSGTQTSTLAPAAINTNPIWNSIDHISAITEGGSPLTGVTKISLNVANGIRRQDVLGTTAPFGFAPSKFKVTGSLTCYMQDASLINKFTGFTQSALAFRLGTGAGLLYDFSIAKMRYTDGKVVAGAGDQDVMVELSFMAQVDATDTILKITRTP